jgi:hypothetical protein
VNFGYSQIAFTHVGLFSGNRIVFQTLALRGNVTSIQFLRLLREVMLLNSSKGLDAEGADWSNRMCTFVETVSKWSEIPFMQMVFPSLTKIAVPGMKK